MLFLCSSLAILHLYLLRHNAGSLSPFEKHVKTLSILVCTIDVYGVRGWSVVLHMIITEGSYRCPWWCTRMAVLVSTGVYHWIQILKPMRSVRHTDAVAETMQL